MAQSRMSTTWVVGLAAAVVVPGLILGVIAARALNREEAYLEKSLEDTLRAEVDGVIAAVQNEIREMTAELDRSLLLGAGQDPGEVFRRWEEGSDLVAVPFLVSADREVLRPRPEDPATEEEKEFLAANELFLSDETPITVFQEVAALPPSTGTDPAVGRKGSAIEAASRDVFENLLADSGAEESDKAALSNVAQARFRQSAEVRRDLYNRAEAQSKRILRRKVEPISYESEEEREASIVVAESLPLSEITARGGYGLIPRLFDSRLELFFWKKLEPSGEIAGCQVNLPAFTRRLLGILPVIYSRTRLLTVLDQNGSPLIDPAPGRAVDWKRPFFAREVGAVLPHWEVAAYLTDPGALASRARLRTFVTGVLIGLLLLSILVGGVIVFRSVSHQMTVAQEKATFAANVSHELKTPLTSIRLFSEMLREGRPASPEKRRKYLDLMVDESKRLSHLINNVLDFSRIERGERSYQMETVATDALVRRTVEGMRVHLENGGFAVSVSASGVGATVRGDPDALEQVLINLLSNAEKYSDGTREIEVAVEAKGSEVVIEVRDRGIGIPPARARKIFEKFYRVDTRLTARTRGAGLGLTIARAIVRDHGGEISCAPRRGGGTVFTVRLPLNRGSD